MSFFLAQMLERSGIGVKIVERDPARCTYLSEKLDKSLILQGNAADTKIMLEEGIKNCDAYIAATSSDEQNCGSTVTQVKICDMARKDVFDGKWHHWAFAFEQVDTPTGDEGATKRQVRLTVYRDYEKLVGPGADGATYIDGALTFPKSGSGCSFILGQNHGSGEENYVTATYDDVRVSPGILPVEKFLRFEKEPRGLTILVR